MCVEKYGKCSLTLADSTTIRTTELGYPAPFLAFTCYISNILTYGNRAMN